MGDHHSDVLGPFLLNNTIICFNVSLLPHWVASSNSNIRNPHELFQSIVPCDLQLESETMDVPMIYFWNLAFALMIISAIIGNFAVLWIVIHEPKMRTITNLFIFNLCLTDLINTLFNSTFNFVYMKNKDWTFGSGFCRMTTFMTHMAIVASVLTMAAIAMERYMTIACPRSPHLSKQSTAGFLLAIWIVSILVATPTLLFSTSISYGENLANQKTACLMIWPDGNPSESLLDHIYQIIFFLVSYVLPMVGLSITYCHLCTVLWRAESDSQSVKTSRCQKDKRKLAKMFIVVLILFGICWLPYHAYFIYTYYYVELVSKAYTQHVFLFFFWLAMANSAVNPVIYFLMNAKFRFHLKTIVQSSLGIFVNVYHRHWYFSRSSSSTQKSFMRKGVLMESKHIKMDVLAGRPIPELEKSGSVVIGSPMSRAAGVASCPVGDCECPSCLVSMVNNNEIVFFRKFSVPNGRNNDEPRLHYYKLKILKDTSHLSRPSGSSVKISCISRHSVGRLQGDLEFSVRT